MKHKLYTVLFIAFLLRVFGINWDQGFHLHPDERMLLIVTERINFFKNLNPDFFNYGSLPIYLLRLFSPSGNYDTLLYVGRMLSIVTDVAIVYLIYRIALLLFKKEKIALLAGFFYAFSFFPIQNSHFFTVDAFMTFFITLLFYLSLLYLQKPSRNTLIAASFAIAGAVTSKFTAILFLPFIPLVIFLKRKSVVKNLLLFAFFFLLFSLLFMPYAYINYQKFYADISLQLKLNSNPYVFPYTLQYVGTLPYWYYLKNIFFWGLGPITSVLSIIGLVALIKNLRFKVQGLVILLFYGFYFLVVGKSAVKFMRYMLPLYPFFALLASLGLYRLMGGANGGVPDSAQILTKVKSSTGGKEIRGRIHQQFVQKLVMLITMLWTLFFLTIYMRPHTRITATNWMLRNIPVGSTLAVEHWDDRLPLTGQERYRFVELPLYELPDNEMKWSKMREHLRQTDYIVIASNRLYTPLQKLNSYPKTAEYYQKLFNGNLGFQKVAEFTSYPGLKIGNWELKINDSTADESFTVYDHPKVLIFKKSR